MIALFLIEWVFTDDSSERYERWIAGEGPTLRLARADALRFVENYLLSDDEIEVSILATHKTTARDADLMAEAMRRERQ